MKEGFRIAANDNFNRPEGRPFPKVDPVKEAQLLAAINVSKFNEPARWKRTKVKEAEESVSGYSPIDIITMLNASDEDVDDRNARLLMYDALLRRLEELHKEHLG